MIFQLDRPAKIIECKYITRSVISKALAVLDSCPASSASRRAGGSNGYRWITGPITTVRDGRMSPEALADTRVVLSAWKWFSERTWSRTVVLGNHPYSVGKMQTAGSHWSEIVRVPSPLLGVTESPA